MATMTTPVKQFGVRGPSNVVGATELVAAALLAARRLLHWACVAGSVLAAGIFLTTLSFLFTTPGSWQFPPDFPVPMPSGSGGFLVNDAFLFGAVGWSAGGALRAARRDAGRHALQTGGL